MKLSLLYLDDTYHPESQISALTGVLVPATDYADLSAKFYQGLKWAINPNERTYNLHPPELHASDMLREHDGVDDTQRLEMFTHIANLVATKRLRLLRMGYFLTRTLEEMIPRDPRLVTLLFANIIQILQPRLAREYVIPVMDGFQHVNLMAGSSQATSVMRQTDLRRSMTIENSENLVGEVLFADSKFSIFTQVADVVGYLRLVSDLESEGFNLPAFKQQLLPIAKTLDECFDHEEIVVMSSDGVPQLPKHRAQREG